MTASPSADPAVARALTQAARVVRAVGRPTLVAAGGNGIVFRAVDPDARPLAIKIPRFDLLSAEGVAVARHCLLREREVLAQVSTPHVPRLIGGDIDGTFLVREFVPGRVLEALVNDPGVDRPQRVRVALQVVDASGQLWRQFHDWPAGGYVIRDFKPRNLVLDDTAQRIALIDVGSVRSERAMLSNQRRTHRVGSGSWRYWAPEQLLEDRSCLDRRADDFSLGSTLYALLFGDPPFRNTASAGELRRTYGAEYVDACMRLELASWVPRPLRDFVAACLSPDPSGRPSAVPGAVSLARHHPHDRTAP
jgi:eukaryotic-like serine/threonine-protein kinase